MSLNRKINRLERDLQDLYRERDKRIGIHDRGYVDPNHYRDNHRRSHSPDRINLFPLILAITAILILLFQ